MELTYASETLQLSQVFRARLRDCVSIHCAKETHLKFEIGKTALDFLAKLKYYELIHAKIIM